jgi:hypothetical protein
LIDYENTDRDIRRERKIMRDGARNDEKNPVPYEHGWNDDVM